jgi:hypothetical protein
MLSRICYERSMLSRICYERSMLSRLKGGTLADGRGSEETRAP